MGGLLPRQRDHRVLVTTRDTIDLPAPHRLDLDVLASGDALELLNGVFARERLGDRRVTDVRPRAGPGVDLDFRIENRIGAPRVRSATHAGLECVAPASDAVGARFQTTVVGKGLRQRVLSEVAGHHSRARPCSPRLHGGSVSATSSAMCQRSR